MSQPITRKDLQKLLTVGVFIKDGTEDAYQFTENMLTINNRPVCQYEVIQEGTIFYLKLKSNASVREPLKIDIVDCCYPVVIRFTERKKIA
jgi:hypothetical protein